jgi:hypothetical protein
LFKDLNQKKCPTHFSHGKGRWGKSLKTKINKGIANTNLPKKTHLSFQIKRVGGAIDYKLR